MTKYYKFLVFKILIICDTMYDNIFKIEII